MSNPKVNKNLKALSLFFPTNFILFYLPLLAGHLFPREKLRLRNQTLFGLRAAYFFFFHYFLKFYFGGDLKKIMLECLFFFKFLVNRRL